MTIGFKIHYHTRWGQQLAVVGSLPELGDGDPMKALVLDYQGDGYWGKTVAWPDPPSRFSYKYVLIDENTGTRTLEWGEEREIVIPRAKRNLEWLLKDAWRARQHPENALYTSAFRDVILSQEKFRAPALRKAGKKPVVHFRMYAPRVAPGQQLCVTGNIEELGNWNPAQPLLLGNSGFPLWNGKIALQSGLTVEYKYGLYDTRSGKIVELEAGENRRVPVQWFAGAELQELLITDTYFRPAAHPWQGAGVAVPVFSLRTRHGMGVGEFLDIIPMVDWAKKVGLRMVQILPVNDTSATHSWVDSYPYAAISVFALHPLYLNLDALSKKNKAARKKRLKEERERLNGLDEVDYEKVMHFKLRYAREVFEEVREAFLKSESFKKFMQTNGHWLKPYAAFCYLRDEQGTVDFNTWGKYATFSEAKLKKLVDPKAAHYREVAFYYFLQYHLDKQLGEAAAYARANRIILKGDIPIGIYRYSVDAWVAPHLYNMDGQAGAPPDPFSDTGQNWGFPTYDWAEMAKNGYQWWQQRLQQLSHYFDAFRIDHILGFFRIWEIPIEQVQGLMGHFNPALPVRREEFDQRGIPFDFDRFCRPFISEYLLRRLFGNDASYVMEHFLDQYEPGAFRLKPAFDTQRKIDAFLSEEAQAGCVHLREGLFDLVSNVLFFEVPGSRQKAFHPRISIKDTFSFQSLPPEVQPRLEDLYINYFYRRQEAFWRQQAMTKLPAIKEATNMLICGEDLGMVPDCVPGVMDELGILSLEIQRMSKNPETEFLQESDIPYLSVSSPSTHDMSPLRAWWEEMEPDQRRRFFREQLGFDGEPPQFCEPWVVERILRQQLNWPSMWVVFPLQDIVAIDGELRRENPFAERINVPSNPKHYWRYRFHIDLEDLKQAQAFNDYFRSMITASGRAD